MEKLKPMPNAAFGLMVLAMSFEDLFHKPLKKLQKLEKMLAPVSLQGKTIVDYGCGPARFTIPAARMVGPTGKVVAVDIQPLAIDIVKRESAKNGLTNVETRLVDSFATGLPDNHADVVFLIDAISPIKDRFPLLKEIHRLLKPAGVLFMDSSHMSGQKAQAIVRETGLFRLLKAEGKEMLWRKR